MKFFVNNNCIGCGLCAGVCPEVFEMTDSGVAQATEDEVPEALHESAQDAMAGCPVAAIEQDND